jgi:hypothetical protein
MTTVGETLTADDARKVSGYHDIDYSISEDSTVLEAVQKFAAFNIGCLVTTDAAGKSFLVRFLRVRNCVFFSFFFLKILTFWLALRSYLVSFYITPYLYIDRKTQWSD